MIRGTTPTQIFHVSVPADLIEGAYVTYAQRGKVILEKRLGEDGVTLHRNNTIRVRLTQEETLKFSAYAKARVQIRFILQGGATGATDPYEFPVDPILKEGMI